MFLKAGVFFFFFFFLPKNLYSSYVTIQNFHLFLKGNPLSYNQINTGMINFCFSIQHTVFLQLEDKGFPLPKQSQ